MSVLQESEDSFFQQDFHLILWHFVFSSNWCPFTSLLESPAHKNSLINTKFLSSSFKHFGLISVACNQTIHLNLAFLTDSVSPGSGLDVVLWVPVRVVNDYHIGTGEIDTNTSCFSWQKEHISLFVRVIVSVDWSLSLFGLDLTIDSFVLVLLELQKLLNELKHMGKLGENEYFFTFFLALFKQFLYQDHLPTRRDELINLLILHLNIPQQIMLNLLD